MDVLLNSKTNMRSCVGYARRDRQILIFVGRLGIREYDTSCSGGIER